jgi:glycosyltransferase involved in cell wall biosynthesis
MSERDGERTPHGVCQLKENYAQLDGLLRIAAADFSRHKATRAAAVCGLSAYHAFTAHCGVFSSSVLDSLLQELGNELSVAKRPVDIKGRSVSQVCHVLTYARRVGGDTRFVYRWIQNDPAHVHSVIIMRPDGSDVHPHLKSAVASSGGHIRNLQSHWRRPLEQAQELRLQARYYDAVMLHLFPTDVAPLMAFSAIDEPKVGVVNHSDHTFWPRGGAPNLIINLREQPAFFTRDRRGMSSANETLLPIPLPSRLQHSHRERQAARATLAIPPNAVVLLTIASGHKFPPFEGSSSLHELVRPLIENNKHLIWLVVGPSVDNMWRTLSDELAEQVRVLGTVWETDNLYAASDIYLDSFPFSSITSLLEAGSCGLPLVTYKPTDWPWLLSAGAPGLTDRVRVARTEEEFVQVVSELVDDKGQRQQWGSLAFEGIDYYHSGEGWRRFLEAFYKKLDAKKISIASQATEPVFGDLDRGVEELMKRISVGSSPIVDAFAGALDFSTRIGLLRKLGAIGFSYSHSYYLPDFLESRYHGELAFLKRAPKGWPFSR